METSFNGCKIQNFSSNLFHNNKLSQIETEEENTKGANVVAKLKRYRDKMKTDTDIYEQM
jgi:hypothetical protein